MRTSCRDMLVDTIYLANCQGCSAHRSIPQSDVRRWLKIYPTKGSLPHLDASDKHKLTPLCATQKCNCASNGHACECLSQMCHAACISTQIFNVGSCKRLTVIADLVTGGPSHACIKISIRWVGKSDFLQEYQEKGA